MLLKVKDLENFSIGATDGVIGGVKDFYFDDEAWGIRYLDVETGEWLSSRRVLISPYSIRALDAHSTTFSVAITKEQVRNSPPIDTHRPVSRQYETDYLGYYGYPAYWGGAGLWGGYAYPFLPAMGTAGVGYDGARYDYLGGRFVGMRPELDRAEPPRKDDDPHLRSCNAVTGYHVHANDGDIGHVEGFIVDTGTWAIRYVIVNTSNWWLGHLALVAPEWIDSVTWAERRLLVDLTRQQVKDAPPYDASVAIDRAAEERIYSYYGRDSYWKGAAKRQVA